MYHKTQNTLKKFFVALALVVATAACDGTDSTQTDTVTFGSRLENEPANNAECDNLSDPCTIIGTVHFPDPDGPPAADGAPVDGVITTFRLRAYAFGDQPRPATLVLAEVDVDPNNDETAEASVVASGPTVMIPSAEMGQEIPILEFEANLPVRKGQYLGIENEGVAVVHNSSSDVNGYWFSPPLAEGQAPRTSNGDGLGDVLVQADITFEVE